MNLRAWCLWGVGFLCWACSDEDGGNDANAADGGDTGGSTSSGGSSSTGGTSSGGSTTVTGGATGMPDGGAVMLDPADYSEADHWLCRPGLADNQCDVDLSVTEFSADGSTMVSDLPPAGDADVDCFYVYPTVDLDFTNVENKDFPEINRDYILDPLLAQAAPLRDLCNLYVPVYRQASIGAFLADRAIAQEKIGIAFADVAAAFDYYLQNFDTGKPLVIMGHSQGAMMSALLIQSVIDDEEELRDRLVAALLIGSLGFYTVPEGEVVGGSFMNVPLCTSEDENGCVVTYNSYAQGFPPPETYGTLGVMATEGQLAGCTHPGGVGSGAALLTGALIPTHARQEQFEIGLDFGIEVDTTFALYRDFFSGECVPADSGHPYLEVSATPAASDARGNPIPFDDPNLNPAVLGLHILDYSFGMENLRALLEAKIAAR